MTMMRMTDAQLADWRAQRGERRTNAVSQARALDAPTAASPGRPPAGRRAEPEHDEQVAFFDWAARQVIEGIELLHAIPNGGARSKATAGKLKAEGVKPGAPDVQWPVPRGGFVGLAIEFKAGDGNPSKEQRERIDHLQREGWCVAVCWSWRAAARTLQGYAGLMTLQVHHHSGTANDPKEG